MRRAGFRNTLNRGTFFGGAGQRRFFNNIESESHIVNTTCPTHMNILQRSFYSDFSWKKGFYLLATAYVAWAFVAHGVQAMMMAEKYMPLAKVVLPESMAAGGLFAVGVIDVTVAALLLMRNNPFVLLYAAIYPFFPMTLKYFATGELEMVGKFLILGFAIISFALWTQFKTKAAAEAAAA